MKEYYKILPIGLFIIAQCAYDNLATLDSANWSIFYFVFQHLSWLLLCLFFAKGKRFIKRLPYYVLAVAYSLHIIRLLSKINMDYDMFRESVNSYEGNLLISALTISLLIIPIIWYKQKK